MSEIIFVPSLAIFFCSFVLFFYYLGNSSMYRKYPTKFKQFLNVSLPFNTYPTWYVGSDLDIKDHEFIVFPKSYEESFYANQTNFVVENSKIILLSIILNSKNHGKAFTYPSSYDVSFHTASLRESFTHIPTLTIKNNLGMLSLSGVRIGRLILEGNMTSIIFITNCWIQSIEFKNIKCETAPCLEIAHSNIGVINLKEGKVVNLSFNNCIVDNIQIPSILKDDNLPIQGYTRFLDTSLAEVTNHHLGGNSNNLVNLRNLLVKASNEKASMYVLGYEKRIQRNELSGISKVIDWLYDYISFYNNSPERTFIFIIFMLLIVYSFLIVGNVSICVNKEVVNITSDWVLYFKNPLLFMIQSTISPVSTMGGNEYFSLENIAFRFIYGILSLIVLLLVGVFAFSLKRKYQN